MGFRWPCCFHSCHSWFSFYFLTSVKKTQVSKIYCALIRNFESTFNTNHLCRKICRNHCRGIFCGTISIKVGICCDLLCSLLMRVSFFISFSFVWGTIADAKGRKPVLIVSSILSAGMSVVFGFSVNFPMAVFTRFLAGFLNGKRIAMCSLVPRPRPLCKLQERVWRHTLIFLGL